MGDRLLVLNSLESFWIAAHTKPGTAVYLFSDIYNYYYNYYLFLAKNHASQVWLACLAASHFVQTHVHSRPFCLQTSSTMFNFSSPLHGQISECLSSALWLASQTWLLKLVSYSVIFSACQKLRPWDVGKRNFNAERRAKIAKRTRLPAILSIPNKPLFRREQVCSFGNWYCLFCYSYTGIVPKECAPSKQSAKHRPRSENKWKVCLSYAQNNKILCLSNMADIFVREILKVR